MGFLFGSALGAAVLAGWPIYLHLRRRRKMRIQSVPSLRLFGFTRRKTKRIRLQQLALLATRVGFVVAISLLLAQPFIAISRYLPLPPVAGDTRDDLVLAAIVDDGLGSMHGPADKSRLDESKAMLKQVIRGLPQNCRISFTLTSSPFPSPPMIREEALDYLSRMSSVPRPGEAIEALRQVADTFAGRQVCILISAPRSDTLWYAADAAFDGTENLNLHFHDVDDTRTTAMIATMDGDVVRLNGKPDDLLGQDLRVTGSDGKEYLHAITAHEALIGEVTLSSSDEDRYLEVTVADGDHPWQRYYHRTGDTARRKARVSILRHTDESGIAADKIITGVLLSSGRDLAIDHLNPDQDPLPSQTDAVVTVDGLNALPIINRWLTAGGGKRAPLVALPPMASSAGWTPLSGEDKGTGPTTIIDPQGLPIDALALLDVRSLHPDRINEPKVGTAVVIFEDGATLLSKEIRSGGQLSWRLGFRVDPSERAVYHPAFPLLLSSLMFPESAEEADQTATVGNVARVDRWFASDQLEGTVTTPGGENVRVPSGGANTTFIKINHAGVYQYDGAGGTRVRVANAPRPLADTTVTFDDLRTRIGGPNLIMVDDRAKISAEHFNYLQASASGEPFAKKRRDLSPIAFALALAFLSIEAVLLHILWRRRAAISE